MPDMNYNPKMKKSVKVDLKKIESNIGGVSEDAES